MACRRSDRLTSISPITSFASSIPSSRLPAHQDEAETKIWNLARLCNSNICVEDLDRYKDEGFVRGERLLLKQEPSTRAFFFTIDEKLIKQNGHVLKSVANEIEKFEHRDKGRAAIMDLSGQIDAVDRVTKVPASICKEGVRRWVDLDFVTDGGRRDTNYKMKDDFLATLKEDAAFRAVVDDTKPQ